MHRKENKGFHVLQQARILVSSNFTNMVIAYPFDYQPIPIMKEMEDVDGT